MRWPVFKIIRQIYKSPRKNSSPPLFGLANDFYWKKIANRAKIGGMREDNIEIFKDTERLCKTNAALASAIKESSAAFWACENSS